MTVLSYETTLSIPNTDLLENDDGTFLVLQSSIYPLRNFSNLYIDDLRGVGRIVYGFYLDSNGFLRVTSPSYTQRKDYLIYVSSGCSKGSQHMDVFVTAETEFTCLSPDTLTTFSDNPRVLRCSSFVRFLLLSRLSYTINYFLLPTEVVVMEFRSLNLCL